ncbi:class I SAM-dependent methyltransferase [Methanobrevibacter arboriphilus]|uniref:Uncharacterized protein n=1 Tax=Methanobrevibacter arboriphilus TaxID=39441 RepID=A0ACA8R5Y6_METAZ|nr:class I SAM-dependent methyltransferase [Methanobrevibacter arboriphilus]BBL62213.1 hypothetical protein MarbSA_12530 [Methanobrevibacter arboriphilus]
MATINKEFYKGEREYSDGSVEDTILKIVKSNHNLEELSDFKDNWAIFYHLSHLRENILNWYPFKENCSILEVGAGCGALTGLFSQKAGKVKAVELTDRRAQIIYERHKDKENIEIFAGNLNNMEFGEKFDYVILNGVLEYAKQFTNTDDPFKDFLIKIKSFLKNDGVILVAIENRLGLKYISGFKEDHTSMFFSGINQYSDTDKVRTFSKLELEKIIENAGFSNYKFFYPYPDYKFPEIIHTDYFIEKYPFKEKIPNYDQMRAKFFNESLLNNSLGYEGISKYFSNSFLVEIKNDEGSLSENIKLVKLSASRREDFRIATFIEEHDNELIAIKTPLNEKAKKHLVKMSQTSSKNKISKLNYLKTKYINNNSLSYPFIEKNPLDSVLLDLINENDINKFLKYIKSFSKTIKDSSIVCKDYHDSKFSEIFGDKRDNRFNKCLEYPNLDLIFNNVFIDGNEYIIIDYEWCFDFPVPVDFILWRTITVFYYFNEFLEDIIPQNKLLEELDLPEKKYSTFLEWDQKFLSFVRGGKPYEIPNKPIIYLDNDNISQYSKDKVKIKALKKELRKENKKHKNSIRYQIGDLMVKASKPSKKTFTWPYHLIRLFNKNKKEKNCNRKTNRGE